MADTRPDIILIANTPLDVYAALNAQAGFPSVSVGTVIRTQNKGGSTLKMNAGATSPTDADGYTLLTPRLFASNESGDVGAWVTTPIVDSIISVRVVV
tara:strand:+ start:3941 stop:4234 length:294 start_codon:yes stop_codon:yes gene_type:complete